MLDCIITALIISLKGFQNIDEADLKSLKSPQILRIIRSLEHLHSPHVIYSDYPFIFFKHLI